MMARRQRADSTASSSLGSKTKFRNEKLLEGSRVGKPVGQAFVSDPNAISPELVSVVRRKACQVTTYFVDTSGEEGACFGSGGLLRGLKIANSPETATWSTGNVVASRPKKKVKFEIYSSYEVTPVTAKHNLVPEDEHERYVRTMIQFPETLPMEITMPDGGCKIAEYVEVRPATEETKALHTEDNDYSFGEMVSASEKTITKMPFIFQYVPPTFNLRVGHKIGIAVFRTYEITHADAEAPKSIDMNKIYGPTRQACIYTGTVTEISANGKTFGHNINTFEGCSGAIVFLLDLYQPDDVGEAFYGLAVGVHSGGLDDNNNLAFLLRVPKNVREKKTVKGANG